MGDLVPADNISKEDKHSMEKNAMKRLQGLVSSETGEELYSLWEVSDYVLAAGIGLFIDRGGAILAVGGTLTT